MIVYIITGIIAPCIITKMMKTTVFRNIVLSLNHQTINENIFDDLIDYDEQVGMAIYLKERNFYYLGIFCMKDENDSYISLIDYVRVDSDTDEVIYKSTQPTTVVIPFSDIERIEIIYAETSKVWQNLKLEN